MPSIIGLAIPLFVIASFGLSSIWSTTSTLALNQLTFFCFGVFILILLYRLLNPVIIKNLTWPIYFFSIILLLFTLFLGTVSRGSMRWIDLGPFRFQSSEAVKPLLALSFAGFLSTKSHRNLLWLIRQGILALVPILLVLVQPDLGSAAVIGILWLGMLLSSRLALSHIALIVGSFSIILFLAPHILHDYQLKRIESFVNPYADPSGSGYNVIQSMIAVGSGQVVGKGVRQGTQSHLRFLPERHTDFIFASFAEEFGFVGAFLLLTCYLLVFIWIIRAAFVPSDAYSRLLILGIFSMIFFQTIVNIGMNLGIMPVTGITLPFMSYGGSSIVALFTSLSLVLAFLYKSK